MSLACLQPNPDISGIGVRVAIYTQAFLALIPAFVFSTDGITTEQEYESMKVTTHTTLLTACAILLSALIQVARDRLSVHHAVIVLNLSWINNTNALVYMIFYVFTHCELTLDLGPSEIRKLVLSLANDPKARFGIILASIHLCAIAGLGISVWSRVGVFGDQPECTPDTHMVILGFSISVIDRHLRKVSLAIYSIIAVPFVNVLIIGGILAFFTGAPAYCLDLLIHWYATKDRKDYFFTRRYRTLLQATRNLKEIYHTLPKSKPETLDIYKVAYTGLFNGNAKIVNEKIDDLCTMFPLAYDDHIIRKFIKAIRAVALASNDHDREIARIASFCGLLFITFLGTLFLIDTELMIARSKGLVQGGESEWTFGQTLAIVLVAVPLIDSIRGVRTSVRDGPERIRVFRDKMDEEISLISPRGLQLLSKSPEFRLGDCV